jgi:hypothetical protein
MSDTLNAPRSAGAHVTIPTIWVAFALSLLIHAAVLWTWVPRLHDLLSERAAGEKASGPLAVRLVPPPSPAVSAPPALPASPALQPQPPSAKRASPPRAAPRPPPAPPLIAKDGPAPAVAPPPVAPSATAPAPTPVEGDFSSYLEARRRARGASAEDSTVSTLPVEDERARHNRIVAENLGLNRTPSFGPAPRGGGIFQLERVGYNDAEFIFFGWNKDIRRNSKQLIEVEKGANSDIRIAVVRRMIAIIREHESGDFVWVSERLGRAITLSARPGDNAGLEDVLMQEFFPNQRPSY